MPGITYIIYILDIVSEYISSLSPIKQSNRKRTKPTTFFDMEIQIGPTTKVRAAWFCKNRCPIFKELNSRLSTGCTLKFFSQTYEDILINDKTVVYRKNLNFEKSSEIKISNIKTIINEYRLFGKVNIKAFVTEVSPVTTAEVYDKCINMQKYYFMTSLLHLPLLCLIWTVIKYKTIVHISLLTSHSVSICLRAC